MNINKYEQFEYIIYNIDIYRNIVYINIHIYYQTFTIKSISVESFQTFATVTSQGVNAFRSRMTSVVAFTAFVHV